MENETNSTENVEINETSNTTANTIQDSVTYTEQLQTIHEDLGIILSFLIIGGIVILCKYAYKWFDMFFKI